ncbi:hypothetical protein SFIMM107S_03957 [Streptomyces griseus]
MTIWSVMSVPVMPFGKKPPSFQRLETVAVSPASENPTVRTPAQIRIMPMMAVTLTMENQNSSSPKSFTEIRFAPYRMTVNTRADSHCGMFHQYVI